MEILAGLVGWAVQAEPLIATLVLRSDEQDAHADAVVDSEARDPVAGREIDFGTIHW